MHLPNIHLLFGFSLGFEALPSQGSGKNSQFLFFRVNDTFWILVLYFRLDRLRTLWLRYRCWTVLFISRVNRQILIITMLLHYALHYFFFRSSESVKLWNIIKTHLKQDLCSGFSCMQRLCGYFWRLIDFLGRWYLWEAEDCVWTELFPL